MSSLHPTQRRGRASRTAHCSGMPLSLVDRRVEDGASEPLHIQRQPCPECLSRRTIQTGRTTAKEMLYCLDCGYRWERAIPPGRSATVMHIRRMLWFIHPSRSRGVSNNHGSFG